MMFSEVVPQDYKKEISDQQLQVGDKSLGQALKWTSVSIKCIGNGLEIFKAQWKFDEIEKSDFGRG